MDPNNQNPQGDNGAVNKLEQDLQSLKQQTTTVPQQPAPVEQPVTQSPPVPEVLSTASSSFVSPAVPVDTGASVPESPKKSSPLMIIAIILAVIAVLAVVAYVFGAKLLSPKPTPTSTPIAVVTPSPTPNPTANWQTYTNTKYGYSIKYPATYSLSDKSSQADSFALYPSGYNSLTPLQMQTASTIAIEITTLATTPQTWVNMLKAPGYSNLRNKTNVSFGNVQGIQYTFNNTQAGSGQDQLETVMSLKNNTLILISLNNISNESDVKIYNQILSTFKFIEATPAVSPAPGMGEIPADLVAAVKQNAVDQSSPKVTLDKVIIGQFQVEGNYASVAYGYVDDGGAIFWLSKTGGTWKVVTGGQEAPKCSLLKSFNFPVDFSCNP